MAQKMPRNTLLHERRHKRKAGAHTKPGRRVESLREILEALVDDYGHDITADFVRFEMSLIKTEGES